jgi:threonine dehydratase
MTGRQQNQKKHGELTLDLIDEAATYLKGRIRETPCELSEPLSDILGVEVYLKLENLQLTGSFKVRGAMFGLHALQQNGVEQIATCSAGNHGKGLAYAAEQLGMQATIFVPRSVDPGKHKSMLEMGADVHLSAFIGYDETEKWAREQSEALDIQFVSAFDDPLIMAGNGGSVAVEVLSQVPEARSFVMPAGGGGHSAGFSFKMKDEHDDALFTLCQHEKSPAFQMSLQRGRAVTELPGFKTLASGLEGGFGKNTFQILKSRVDHVALVSEGEIEEAMRWMNSNHGYVIEGSSAVGIAACLKKDIPVSDKPVVVLISGQNIAEPIYYNVLNIADS